MADINFDCPLCGQNLDAPSDMAGWAIDCPNCGKKIKVPVPPGAEPSPMPPVDTSSSDERAMTGLIEDPTAESMKKGSTVRIDVPEEYLRPAPSQRIVKIKRLH